MFAWNRSSGSFFFDYYYRNMGGDLTILTSSDFGSYSSLSDLEWVRDWIEDC